MKRRVLLAVAVGLLAAMLLSLAGCSRPGDPPPPVDDRDLAREMEKRFPSLKGQATIDEGSVEALWLRSEGLEWEEKLEKMEGWAKTRPLASSADAGAGRLASGPQNRERALLLWSEAATAP